MATGKKFYWMKLKESFMTSDTVDFFMSQPDGANYVVLYQMLCLMTLNSNGRLSRQIGEMIIPYDVAKIQRDTKWFTVDTIRVALELYKQFGLIYEEIDGTLVMSDYVNLVGSGTDWSEQKQKQRKVEPKPTTKLLPKPTKSSTYPYTLGKCTVTTKDTIIDEWGQWHRVDEKRYGGNGKRVLARDNCTCQMCGRNDEVLIHHKNGYSNEMKDLITLCKQCHGIAHSSGFEGFVDDEKNAELECEQLDTNGIQHDSQSEKPSKYSKDFERFWEIYPRKIDKGNAYKKFCARLNDGFSPEELIQAAENYGLEIRRNHTEPQFIKHPKTFLSDATPFTDYIRDDEPEEIDGNPFAQFGV